MYLSMPLFCNVGRGFCKSHCLHLRFLSAGSWRELAKLLERDLTGLHYFCSWGFCICFLFVPQQFQLIEVCILFLICAELASWHFQIHQLTNTSSWDVWVQAHKTPLLSYFLQLLLGNTLEFFLCPTQLTAFSLVEICFAY